MKLFGSVKNIYRIYRKLSLNNRKMHSLAGRANRIFTVVKASSRYRKAKCGGRGECKFFATSQNVPIRSAILVSGMHQQQTVFLLDASNEDARAFIGHCRDC